jgi:hypothetical protein
LDMNRQCADKEGDGGVEMEVDSLGSVSFKLPNLIIDDQGLLTPDALCLNPVHSATWNVFRMDCFDKRGR